MEYSVIGKKKRNLVLIIVAICIVIMISFMIADWIAFFQGYQSIYSAIMKPMVSILTGIVVFSIGKNALDEKDKKLLTLSYFFIIPTDISMSIVRFAPNPSIELIVFLIGGVLSILAHIVLIWRHGKGFEYLKSKERSLISKILPLLVIYAIIIVIFIPLIPGFMRVGQLEIAAFYAGFLGISTWIAYETIRNKLYPPLNAWFIFIAITCWLLTEIVGAIYNIQIGVISDLIFNIIWIFYGTNVILLSLSGYRWTEE
ncbi:MAG: hypothetical protein ACFFCV_01925 [Promethearchaeota archaeon]